MLTSFLLILLVALLALTIDVGYMQNARVEIERAVDAGALAGAGTLVQGQDVAAATARDFIKQNRVAGAELLDSDIEIESGSWNREASLFASTSEMPHALRVRAERREIRPMLFGRVFGRDRFSVAAEAIAVYQPRDMVLVLDYSASMNDDSELRSIDTIGRTEVETNLQTIYHEMGSPTYGTLDWAPQYLRVKGVEPSNTYKPQLFVEYRYNEVYVTSTKSFHRIRLYNSSGSYTTYTGTGAFNASLNLYEHTMNFASNQITRVEVKSGYNSSSMVSTNQYTENFYFDTTAKIRAHAKNWFGLNSVTYPFPTGGSWDDFIDYCRTNSYNSAAGYKYRFGYLNLVNYWLEKYPKNSQIPVLWNTSEYPITAVKNAVTVFLAFLQEADTDDRLALAVYNSSDGTGLLERELGQEFHQIEQISRERQAGHYHSNTNIGAGLNVAWNELDQNARPGAFKLIVLMTDGLANMPTSDPMGYLMAQVDACKQRRYPVVTISLGAGADAATLQQIADETGGFHFNIPGGQSVSAYEAQLKDAFRKIAEKRPLQLVH